MKKTQRLFVLILALCMLVQVLPVAAFEFEVPEAAEEIMEIADNAALSDDTIPGFPETTLDDSFGRLVAFWTFEGDDPGKAVYADESIGGNAYIWLYKANENSKTLNSTAEGYSSLTSTAWNIQFADTTVFKTGKDVPVGKYTVNMKIMRKKMVRLAIHFCRLTAFRMATIFLCRQRPAQKNVNMLMLPVRSI